MSMLSQLVDSLTLIQAFQQVFYAAVLGFLTWIVTQGCEVYHQACRVVHLLENAERHHAHMGRQMERLVRLQSEAKNLCDGIDVDVNAR